MVASLDGFISRRDGRVDFLDTADEFPTGATMNAEEIAAFLGTLWHFRRTLRIDLGEPLAQLIRAACSATSAEQLAMIEASVRERA